MKEILYPVSVEVWLWCVSDEDWAVEVCPVVSLSGSYEAIPVLCEGGAVEDYMFAVLRVVVYGIPRRSTLTQRMGYTRFRVPRHVTLLRIHQTNFA